ncbi:MAG: sensor histidine kinase, partial [Flavobacteriales bacterium]
MAKKQGSTGPLFVFYILLVYVIFQFCWWGYHIHDLDREVIQLRQDLFDFREIGTRMMQTDAEKELLKRKIMIIGEGSVFLLFLLLGAYQIHRTFRKEQMLARQQRNFLLSVTHELKSPIASVKLCLQTILKRELDVSGQKDLAAKSLQETNRLGKLVDNILMAANVENPNYSLSREDINLSEIIRSNIEWLEKFASTHQLITDIPNDIIINADRLALISIVQNLVENAIKYSPEGSVVKVEARNKKDRVILSVKDEGIGISHGERKHIFKKFYRV